MKRWIHSDYEAYLADQHTSDNNLMNPGYAEAQPDEEEYGLVESLGWEDAEAGMPKKNYNEFCKACNLLRIECSDKLFEVYNSSYDRMLARM